MAVQELNYWLTTVQMPTPPAQPLPETADVAVIGAGFTGLSAALALAKRGARVIVLDSQTIGWGASSRNGGMVLTGLKLGVNKLISLYGRELTRRRRLGFIRAAARPCAALQPTGVALYRWRARMSLQRRARPGRGANEAQAPAVDGLAAQRRSRAPAGAKRAARTSSCSQKLFERSAAQ